MGKRIRLIVAIGVLIILVPVTAILITRAINAQRFDTGWDPNVTPDTYSGDLSGLEVSEIHDGYARGFRLTPEGPSDVSVVVFGGSEGGTNFPLAASIARAGYDTYPLYFFSAEGQQEALPNVPIDEVLPLIKGPVILVGQSKGAELVLNIAAHRADELDVAGVVALMPADYSYQGLGGSETASSWTLAGEPLPYIGFQPDSSEAARNSDLGVTARMLYQLTLGLPVRYREVYQLAVDTTSPAGQEAARIPVENSEAELLLVAGTDDGVWDSEGAARRIAEQRPEGTSVRILPTGHVPGAPRYTIGMDLGGPEDPDPAAAEELTHLVLSTLGQWTSDEN